MTLMLLEVGIPLAAAIVLLVMYGYGKNPKYKKLGFALLGVSALLYAGLLFTHPRQEEMDLQTVARQIQAQFPMQVDPDTRADSVEAGESSLNYRLTLINHDAADIDQEKFQQGMNEMIAINVKENPNYKAFLGRGIALNFEYYSRDGVRVGTFHVPADAA